jgi:uncharacterized membrane protein YfcA
MVTPPHYLTGRPVDGHAGGRAYARWAVTSTADLALLVGAGALAGTVGTAGGITSLVSYPALLAVGVPALPANVTNIVALVACWPGSALASRPELAGRGTWVKRWAPVAVAGAIVGSGLLLSTPSGVFRRIVPFLLVFASVGLLLQPRLAAWQARRPAGGERSLWPYGLFLVSAYNGYFGAGSGVMLLALLLLSVDEHIATANALKNMVLGLATTVSAVVFVTLGHVYWAAAAALAVGAFVGSMAGPPVARRAPANVLRALVALTGIGLAIRLWAVPG